jgi:hypothetical protein
MASGDVASAALTGKGLRESPPNTRIVRLNICVERV